MSLVHVASPDAVRPRHVAMIALVLLTLAGVGLLTSGAGSVDLPDGARPWRPDSVFRAIVELLNLHYAYPTPLGVEIKSLVFGLGTAVAVFAVSLALALRARGEEVIEAGDTVVTEPGAAPEPPAKKHVAPVLAAQALMLLYVGWSFASMIWSDAPDIAYYGSIDLALTALWPFAICYGLSRSSFRFAAYVVAGIGAAVAVMALLYVRERNPTLRASYPIGNPLQLAACLLPVLFVAFGMLAGQVRDFGNPQRVRRTVASALSLAILFLAAWAFWETASRSGKVGLIAGAAAFLVFNTSGRTRIASVIIGLILAGLAVYLFAARVREFSPTGRDVSLRERWYTWGYALDLIGQNKLLGHGQGGYTRKADALAAGADVLEDPEALKSRVAHAHNEWLEVWTDLGSIGLVLFLGSLLLTLLAAAQALPTMPKLSQRWVLVALMAALAGLMVEEMANVGLRLPGLAPFFFTVVGLLWAASMPESPAPVRALQRSRFTRFAAVVIGAALAVLTTYWSVTDFRAARAEHQVSAAIEKLQWDEAIGLAETARRSRLDPHRRLVAHERLCEVYLHIARVYQVNGLRRIQAAMQTDPPDAQRLALGQNDAEAAEFFRREGMSLLKELVSVAPNFYNSNWVEYQLEQIRADFARFRGDAEAARQLDQHSAVALARELDRRPYDANMAALLVQASASTMSVEDICRTLARPLRYNPVPSVYYDIAGRVLTVPAFMEKFSPIYGSLRSTAPAEAVEQEPLAPEMLRLASVIWFQEGSADVSLKALESACAIYDVLAPRFALAAASCFAELSDRRFYDDPAQVAQALSETEEAIRRAPQSNEGRQLTAAVKHARVPMLLSAGNETAARETLLEFQPDASEAALRTGLAGRYAGLAATVMQRSGKVDIERLRAWVDRSLELDDRNPLAWQQKADLAFRVGNDEECVRCLKEARRRGIGDQVIYRFVDLALAERPTSGPLLAYRDELAAELGIPIEPPATLPTSAPATQPTTLPATLPASAPVSP